MIGPSPGRRALLPVLDLNRWTNYNGAHRRVYAWRGRASNYLCVDCDRPANQWSYTPKTLRHQHLEHHNGQLMPYSTDPWDYTPRCLRCHVRLDRGLSIVPNRNHPAAH